MKFKKGDKVRVIRKMCPLDLPVNSEGYIVEVTNAGELYCYRLSHIYEDKYPAWYAESQLSFRLNVFDEIKEHIEQKEKENKNEKNS